MRGERVGGVEGWRGDGGGVEGGGRVEGEGGRLRRRLVGWRGGGVDGGEGYRVDGWKVEGVEGWRDGEVEVVERLTIKGDKGDKKK